MNMRKPLPLATIGITCYNAEDTIARAIDSALEQSYRNTEILIVDDASSDKSISIVKNYADKHESITLILHDKNQGAPRAYNQLVQKAKGKYISFFDDDDVSHPERVSKTVEALQNHSDIVVCFCDRTVAGYENKVIKGLTEQEIAPEQFVDYMLDAVSYQFDPKFYHSNSALFKSVKTHGFSGSSCGLGIMTAPTSLFKKELFDPKMLRFCDTDWNLRVAKRGVGAINVSEPLMTQYITEGSEKGNINQKRILMYTMRKHKSLYEERRIYYPNIHFVDESNYIPSKILSDPKRPLVTVGFLTYNCETTVYQALESVLFQTYSNVEVIIIDDASSDTTVNIIHQFDDPRIKYFLENNENKGAGYNRNIVTEHANGEYTIFFDDDDVALPDRIESQISALLKCDSQEEDETISIADFYHYAGGFLGPRHSTGLFQGYIDSNELQRLIWHVILMHTESKHLLPNTGIPIYPYALGTSLMCAKTIIFKKLRFDPKFKRMQDLEFLVRFSRQRGGLVNHRKPIINIYSTSGEEKAKWKVLNYSSKILKKHSDDVVNLFGFDVGDIISRNSSKIKLLKGRGSYL